MGRVLLKGNVVNVHRWFLLLVAAAEVVSCKNPKDRPVQIPEY